MVLRGWAFIRSDLGSMETKLHTMDDSMVNQLCRCRDWGVFFCGFNWFGKWYTVLLGVGRFVALECDGTEIHCT